MRIFNKFTFTASDGNRQKKGTKMSLKDILNASKIRKENDRLKQILTPEMQNIIDLQNVTAELNRTITELQSEVQSKQNELQKVQKDISEKRSQLIVMDDEILVQEFGLYKPTFDFATSLDYKEELAKIRSTQKELIKNKRAVTGNMAMQFNGSSAKGKRWLVIRKNFYCELLTMSVMILFLRSNTLTSIRP